jgi:argininosuccinate synthase
MPEPNSSKKKVILAFSGGLDTSYCAIYLAKELNLEVHAVAVNTGGFDAKEQQSIRRRAEELGVTHFEVLDVTDEFYEKAVRYLIFGNILKNNTYPLSVSAERVFQAVAVAEYAIKTGAEYIAHGSTGAGNDQVRFDYVFHVMCPEIEVLTPIRRQKLSRKEEIDYLKAHGIDLSWEKAKYSINRGLWGTSVGGAETLTSHQSLPEEAWPTPLSRKDEEEITLHFEKGEPAGLNEQKMGAVECIQQLEKLAAPFGIGRDIHVGDTIIGIKGRVGFEASAPLIIIKAHHLLEKHVLGKWQQYWKEQLGNWYGMLMHEGQYLDPVMRNIETFLEDTQQHVSGKVFVKLQPGRFELLGIESDYDLMQSGFGTYGEENTAWTGEDVQGFTKILANQNKIIQAVQKDD